MCYNYTRNFIQAIDGYTYESGQSWTAESSSGSLSGPIKDITAASNSNADLHVFLCKDPEFYGMYHILQCLALASVLFITNLFRSHWTGLLRNHVYFEIWTRL